MEEFGRLSGGIDQIELGLVEREVTPEFLMKLSIQLHLYNWTHKADLQPPPRRIRITLRLMKR